MPIKGVDIPVYGFDKKAYKVAEPAGRLTIISVQDGVLSFGFEGHGDWNRVFKVSDITEALRILKEQETKVE